MIDLIEDGAQWGIENFTMGVIIAREADRIVQYE